jgi:hypothetical protein
VSVLLRQPMSLTLAFLGTLLPLYGCLARIGCFLGGCCYGKPSPVGILYPASTFHSIDHGCRRSSPSPNPGMRVFPIQLVEATVQAVLFVTLATLVWHCPHAAASIFWLYLLLYAVSRCSISTEPPAPGLDTGAFRKRKWYAWDYRWSASRFWSSNHYEQSDGQRRYVQKN